VCVCVCVRERERVYSNRLSLSLSLSLFLSKYRVVCVCVRERENDTALLHLLTESPPLGCEVSDGPGTSSSLEREIPLMPRDLLLQLTMLACDRL